GPTPSICERWFLSFGLLAQGLPVPAVPVLRGEPGRLRLAGGSAVDGADLLEGVEATGPAPLYLRPHACLWKAPSPPCFSMNFIAAWAAFRSSASASL